jgi:hypothetical protein
MHDLCFVEAAKGLKIVDKELPGVRNSYGWSLRLHRV